MDNLSKIKTDIWSILEKNMFPDISNESGKMREYLIQGIKIENHWGIITIYDMSSDNYAEVKNKVLLSLLRKYLRDNIKHIKRSNEVKSLFNVDVDI